MKTDQNYDDPENIQHLFSEIAKSITASLEMSEIINAVMKKIQLFFKPRNWSILQLDHKSQKLIFIKAKGIDISLLNNVSLNLGEGIAGYVAETGKSKFVKNIQQDPNFSKKIDKITGFTTQSIIAVPIKFQNQVLGVIELINAIDDREFTQTEVEILETIADFTAIALRNAHTHNRINWLALHDPLTGCYNRSQLDHMLQKYHSYSTLSHHRQTDNLCALTAWIDVDNFKQVNDTYGHQVGDQLLVKVAGLLQKCCRDKDFIFRIGGDEFLLLMKDLQKKDIPKTKKRLKKQLEEYSGQIMPVSGFSFGITAGILSKLEELIIEADNLMYQHKRQKKQPPLS